MVRAFGFSIPLAMAARWTGRRLFCLPLNGLQRLLWFSWVLAQVPVASLHWRYIQKIEDRGKIARLMTDVFGSFDEDVQNLSISSDDDGD